MAQQKRPSGTNVVSVCRALAEPLAAQLGLSVWDVRFVKEGADWFLRIIIDKEEGVTINDCVDMTHLLNPVLDEADPIAQSYCLEVMSPGIERELIRPEHFEAYNGLPVTVKRYRPDESGQREFVGLLISADNETLVIEDEDEQQRIFSRKDVAAVHAVDLWDDDITDQSMMEE